MKLDDLYKKDPYGLKHDEKERVLFDGLLELTEFHREHCVEYGRILRLLGYNRNNASSTSDIPCLPVRMFKEYELLSVDRAEVIKTMTSSGTSGQQVSKIFLDRENVKNQTKTLTSIISSYIGKKRLPLLLLDTEMVKKDRSMFSARGAGIIGFTTFGRDVGYALNENMEPDLDRIRSFYEDHGAEPILMFGYTYMIWQFIVRKLEDKGLVFPFKDVVLFHVGGWKKIKDQAVDTAEYNRRVNAAFGGNVRVHNYYGMAEQLGSIFVECEYGHMHCSNYSDVHIRRPEDFSEADKGERGLIELLSLLPTSYPGHALLTEDEGEILGEDDCPCGRCGKYFKIHGRIKGAELRGCSDTYERR
ncbi:MAG: hypothetical protein K5841_07665 [Fretibacterium sp.]|nr:hypothetical protein [Fretibacterium sp.]